MSPTVKIISRQEPVFSATNEKVMNGHELARSWSIDRGNRSLISLHSCCCSEQKLSMILTGECCEPCSFWYVNIFNSRHNSSFLCILYMIGLPWLWHTVNTKKHVVFQKKKKCLITPLSPHNGRLSITTTFFCPQGDCCGEVRQNYRVDSYFFYL